MQSRMSNAAMILPGAIAGAYRESLVMAGVVPRSGRAPASAAQVVIGTGSGRLGATVAALVALIGVVIGGLALARSAGRIGTGNGRDGAIAAVVAGLIGMVLGGLHLGHLHRWHRHRQRTSRGHRGPGAGADRHGPRWAGSCPLPPHR